MHLVRPATLDDVAFLTEVVVTATRHQSRLPADFDEAHYRRGFADWTASQVADVGSDSTTSVVEVDGRRVGRLRTVRTDDEIELAGIQLLPEAQSRGLGSRLVEELAAEAAATSRRLVLEVEADNPRARALYARLGFVETARTDTDVRMTLRRT